MGVYELKPACTLPVGKSSETGTQKTKTKNLSHVHKAHMALRRSHKNKAAFHSFGHKVHCKGLQ